MTRVEMALDAGEVKAGTIAYFAIDDLRSDSDIRHTGGSPDPKGRPFVCYAVDDKGQSFWTALTTDNGQARRTKIDPSWIRDAVGALATRPQIVNDGGHTYVGSPSTFAKHSAAHDSFTSTTRPSMTAEGLTAVVAAVASRKGQLPSPTVG